MEPFIKMLRFVLSRFGLVVLKDTTIEQQPLNKLTIEIPITAGRTKYMLDQYQRLNNTILKRLYVPYATPTPTNTGTAMLEANSGAPIADIAAITNAYITLYNRSSQLILDDEPLINYLLDANVNPERYQFDNNNIDWTKSFIRYPTATVPDAEDGNSILIVVGFEDPINWDAMAKQQRVVIEK